MADDWMTDTHKAAALEGFLSNPVAMAYARQQAGKERAPDLVAWLRTKIAQERDLYGLAAKRPRSNKPMLQSDFDRIEAHTAILAIHNVVDVVFATKDPRWQSPRDRHCVGCGFDAREEYATPDVNDCPTLRALALAYQHREGFREEWR